MKFFLDIVASKALCYLDLDFHNDIVIIAAPARRSQWHVV